MFFSDNRPFVEGDGVYLREPQMSDYKAWAALRAQSRARQSHRVRRQGYAGMH